MGCVSHQKLNILIIVALLAVVKQLLFAKASWEDASNGLRDVRLVEQHQSEAELKQDHAFCLHSVVDWIGFPFCAASYKLLSG